MPEPVQVIVGPRQPVYEVRLIRTALQVPVQRKARALLRRHAPDFLERLRDEQPNGAVPYRFRSAAARTATLATHAPSRP